MGALRHFRDGGSQRGSIRQRHCGASSGDAFRRGAGVAAHCATQQLSHRETEQLSQSSTMLHNKLTIRCQEAENAGFFRSLSTRQRLARRLLKGRVGM